MLDRLKAMFRSDDLINSLSVFPEIDEAKISRELKLEAEGKNRGKRNQPPAGATDPDHIEEAIRDRIGNSRRQGLENFERNQKTYNERLSRANEFRKEVDIVAGTAQGDFATAVHGWKAAMTRSIERLNETYAHRKSFRAKHKLDRPAKHFEGWTRFIALTIIFVVIEGGMNAVMFSRGNEQGLLGGLLTAVIFSILNVGFSTLLGTLACNIHHTRPVRKLLGTGAILAWIAFAAALNFMIAHFRDLIDQGVAWMDAVKEAVPAFLASPLGLSSMDSWILVGIGLLISILAFMKGMHARDPFPGYAQVEMELDQARAEHERDLSRAIGELTEKRDLAIDELRDADRQVREGISEAIDALFGQTALNSHLEAFLDQCDSKLAHLLAIYRDANRSARSEAEPPSFALPNKFTPFVPSKVEDGRKHTAEVEADRVSETVDTAIKGIFETYNAAIREFRLPEDIQRGEHLRDAS
ncbi:MAG: hypothetical protein Q4615_03065 [Paracoccus aminovorans]|nr:hypothetical protein [Paracoccus aminovorans]